MKLSWLKKTGVMLALSLLMAGMGVAPMYAEQSSPSQGVLRNAYLLLRLQDYLNNANLSFSSLQQKMEEARGEIEENRDKIATLAGQLQHLEILVEESNHKIRNVEIQVQVKEQDIAVLMESIESNEIQRLDQSRALGDYLQLLYFEKNLYFDQNNQVNSFKLFLQDNTLSRVLQNGTYIRLLEQQSEAIMSQLKSIEFTTKASKVELLNKRQQLGLLRLQLDGESRNLEAELEGKKNLLEQTQGSDEIYRELFASYKLAQEVILQDINLFSTNIDALDERISILAPQLSEGDLAQLDAIKSDATRSFGIRAAADFLNLSWPVNPYLGLTAFFEDSGYVSTFGVQHHALDIPQPHHTIFYAPADGVVYKVVDTAALEDPRERLGYGYLIIAHRKGVMTLYGHLGASLVTEGDFVQKGQILGMTGGTPGTPGSGMRTTGAHLHLEVFQDGIRVDPLEYLSLDSIPESKWGNIPGKYLLMMEQKLSQALEDEGFDDFAVEALEESGRLDQLPNLDLEIQDTLEISLPDEEVIQEEEFWERGEE